MLTVVWRNPADSLDVNNDHFIAADDVLTVINTINAQGSRALPNEHPIGFSYFDPNGDQQVAPDDVLTVINAINAGTVGLRELRETGRLRSEKSISITLGQESGSRIYRASIDAKFDITDKQTALEDVLQVFLVTPNNFQDDGSPIFTLAGSHVESVPELVHWDGSTLEVDLTKASSFGSLDTASLRFQLLSSDSDLGTTITIKPLSNELTADEPSDLSFAISKNLAPIGGPLNLASLTTTSDLQLLVENVQLDPITLRYTADMRLRNNGVAVGRDVAAIFRGLFHIPGVLIVDVEGRSGLTNDGQFPEAYVNFHNAIAPGGLTHGMTSDPITVTFFDPHEVTFFIRPEIKANANHAPVLNAIGPLSVMPGSVLTVPLNATDADGDTLKYSIVRNGPMPTSELTADGKLIFRPSPTQLGTYTFNVIASDDALETTRTVTLNVLTDPDPTTRVSGTVLKTNGQPLAGVRVDVGPVQVVTAANGTFTANLGTGSVVSDTIKIRGELITGVTTYPFIAEKLAFVLEHPIYEHYNNVIVRPIYLPGLDSANAVQINPAQDTLVTTAAIPGAAVMVKAGTLMNQQGTPFTGKLSITEVPSNLTPAALPHGFSTDMVVTIQPGEMVFAAPAPLSLPNQNGYAPGERFELWSINPVTGEFDSVGMGQVSADGSTIDTISGGIRNSSWHFFVVPEVAPQDNNPRNQNPGCKECKKRKGLTSEVELHSGEVIETHNLVTYQADGATRGLTLNYDSLRADPRPIITFGTDDVPELFRIMTGRPIPTPDADSRYVASISIEEGSFKYQIPGYTGIIRGLYGGEHFWTYSSTSHVEAALQADLRSFPSGVFNYTVEAGFIHGDAAGFTGTRKATRSEVISVNSINSPFGAGWGLAGLQSLVVNPNGSVLIIDGDGSEVRFAAGTNNTYPASPGDFTKLERLNGLFRQTTTDKTVYQFNADNQLATVTDKNGSVTTYQYSNKLLTSITDSVGLTTTFTYTNNRVTKITDPAGRMTTLAYDSIGNLTSIIDPDNSRRTWDYDNDHHMIAEVDQLGRRETTEYGFHGRAIGAITKDQKHIQLAPLQTQGLYPASQTTDPLNSPAVTDLRGVSARYLDPNGTISETPLDGRGQELADRDRFGLMPSVTRDNDSNLPTSTSDGRGNLALMAYDAQGNLIKRLDSLSGGGGGETIGQINPFGDVDHYTFTGHAGQRLYIDGPTSSFNAGVTLTDSAENLIDFADAFSAVYGSYYTHLAVLPKDDVYSVTVQQAYNPSPYALPGSTGDYRFRLIDVAKAPKLPIGTALLGAAKESQFFQIDAQRGQTLRLADQSGTSRGLMHVYVFGPQGERLEYERSKPAWDYHFPCATSGTYTVMLRPSSTDGKVLRYQFQPSLAEATPSGTIGLDVDHTGNFLNGSKDFTFTAPAGTPIQFYFFEKGGHGVSIYDPVESKFLYYAGGGPSEGSDLFVVPRSGTYTVGVGRTYPGYAGELDDFAFRLMDLSVVPVVQVGSTITGTLAQEGRVAAYRFQGQAGQRIDFGTPKPGTYHDLRIGGSPVFNGPYSVPAQGIVTLPHTAEYTLIIKNGAGSTLPTDFAVTLTPLPANLTPVVLDAAVSGQLTAGSGRRYLQLNVTKGDQLYFDDLGSSDKIRVRTQLLNGGGQLLNEQVTLAANESRILFNRSETYVIVLDADEADRPASYNFKFHSAKTSTSAMTLGQTIQSTFTEPIQTNVYTFNGTAGQKLHFDKIGTSLLSLELGLIGPATNLGSTGSLWFEDPAGTLIVLPQTGVYRLEFRNSTAATGNYSFRMTDVGALPAIVSGASQTGTIHPPDKIDLYRVAATAGQRLTLDKTLNESAFRFRLFHPNGDSTILSAAIDPIAIPFALTGDYTVAVEGISANSFSYSFTATIATDTPVTPANLDQIYSGTGDGSQTTVGTFTANAGTVMFLDARAGSGGVSIYDAANNLVEQTFSLVDRFLVLPASGNYTVKVQAFGNFAFRLFPANAAPLVNLEQNLLVPQSPLNVTDLYRLNLAAAQTIQLDRTSGGSDVAFKLLSPTSEFNSIFGSNLESLRPATAVTAGTYYLTVTRTFSEGGYGFQIHDVDTAPLITYDQPSSGVANPASQAIIRRFNGVAGQRILLSSNGGNWNFFDPQHEYIGGTGAQGVITLPSTGIYTIERDNDDLSAPADFSVTLKVLDDSIQPIVPAYLAAADMSVTYDPNFSQPTSVTNELGHKTLTDIDPVTGNTRSITRVVGAVGGADDQVTTMTYLTSGLIKTMTDPLGRITDFEYDSRRRLIMVTSAKGTSSQTIVQYEYASLTGNVSAYVDENNHRTTFEHDAVNRLTKITESDPDGAGPLASPITQFTYDLAGNRLKMIDANNRVSSMAYDQLDRLKSVTDPGNNTTKYAYDGIGNLLSVTDPLNQLSEYSYDQRNRLTESVDPAGKITKYEYDLSDNLIALTDASGNVTTFEYDARDRLTSRIDPLGEATTYSYDAADNLRTMVDRLGRTTMLTYDDLDRPIQEVWKNATGLVVNTITYAYDKADNLLQAQDNFSTVAYAYDSLDRVAQTQTGGPGGIPSATLAYTYDAASNRLSVVDTINGLAGATNTYTYDALDRTTRIVQAGTGVATKRVDMQYNPLGQTTSLSRFSDAAGASAVATSTFVYDTLNRLSSITHKNPASAVLDSFAYQYDAASRITRITDIDGVTNYTYDSRDELTGANHADPANPDESYAYDATGNRLSSHKHGTGYDIGDGPGGAADNNRLTSDGTYNYSYDDEGNLTKRTPIVSGAVREFAYDQRNRLIQVSDKPSATGAATQVVKYLYDLFDRRIAKTVDTSPADAADGVFTTFIYDGDDVLVEYRDPDGTGAAPSAESMRYLYGSDVDQVLAQEDAAGNVQWHLTDHLGTVHDLVNNSGQVVNHLKYDSYGNVISESNPAISTRYRFIGREFDSETGLMYYRARYYDTATGRFINEDPIGQNDGINVYAYVQNDPVSFTDPNGDRRSAVMLTRMTPLAIVATLIGIQLKKMLPIAQKASAEATAANAALKQQARDRLATGDDANQVSNAAPQLTYIQRQILASKKKCDIAQRRYKFFEGRVAALNKEKSALQNPRGWNLKRIPVTKTAKQKISKLDQEIKKMQQYADRADQLYNKLVYGK